MHLEGAGFHILTVVCDKASVNQKFVRFCTQSEKEKNNDQVGYRSVNLFNKNEPIFFISDICHLIKTARNCVANSGRMKTLKDGSKKYVRLLKKNGKHILWQHFTETFKIDSQSNLRKAPKLTYAHVNITPFSAMRVKLAAQVLSSTVANVMEDVIGDCATETIKFIRLHDTFFDIFNIANLTDGRNKRKPALDPFRSINDWRFKWLEEEFLKYFNEWDEEVQNLEVPEGFEKDKMLLSKETLEGIRITVFSTIGAVKYLLKKGASFVLTAKFNQDPLEQYFGKHRAAIGAGENPTVSQYKQSVKRIKLMGSIALSANNGNCTQKKRVERRKVARKSLQY